MRTPKELQHDAAKDFWKRNAPILEADGRLTEATRDAFVLLCQIWAKYISAEVEGLDAIKVVALAKQVQQLLAAFGMTPAARRRLKLDEVKPDYAKIIQQALESPYAVQDEEDSNHQ